MEKKTFLIELDFDTHKQYKELCKKHGLNMTQQLRNFIEREIIRLKEKING